MASTEKTKVTKAEIDHAQTLWTNFTVLLKWGTIATIACLAIMAITLV